MLIKISDRLAKMYNTLIVTQLTVFDANNELVKINKLSIKTHLIEQRKIFQSFH